MDIIEIQRLIKRFPSLDYHVKLIDEIVLRVSDTDIQDNFVSVLLARLKDLETLGYNACKLNSFEKLSYAPNLYSMHIKGKGFNYRILYSFNRCNKILLHGFEERSGKRATDYSNAIPKAVERRKDKTGR